MIRSIRQRNRSTYIYSRMADMCKNFIIADKLYEFWKILNKLEGNVFLAELDKLYSSAENVKITQLSISISKMVYLSSGEVLIPVIRRTYTSSPIYKYHVSKWYMESINEEYFCSNIQASVVGSGSFMLRTQLFVGNCHIIYIEPKYSLRC